ADRRVDRCHIRAVEYLLDLTVLQLDLEVRRGRAALIDDADQDVPAPGAGIDRRQREGGAPACLERKAGRGRVAIGDADRIAGPRPALEGELQRPDEAQRMVRRARLAEG